MHFVVGRALFELVSPEFVKKFVFKAPSEDEYAKWVVALFKYKVLLCPLDL